MVLRLVEGSKLLTNKHIASLGLYAVIPSVKLIFQVTQLMLGAARTRLRREVAGDGGFEPPLPDSESGVLPLD